MLMPTCNGKTIPCFWGIKLRYTWFHHWAAKIPWRRTWQPTPVLLPGEPHGQRRLGGYSPRRLRVVHDRATSHSTANNKDKPYYIYFYYYISTNTKENLEDKKLWCKGINITLMTDRSRSPCWEGADTLPERGQGRVWCAATGVQFRMHTARLEQLEEKQWEGQGGT